MALRLSLFPQKKEDSLAGILGVEFKFLSRHLQGEALIRELLGNPPGLCIIVDPDRQSPWAMLDCRLILA